MSPAPNELPAPGIHLVWLGSDPPSWPLGLVVRASAESAAEIRDAGDQLVGRLADASAGDDEDSGLLLWSALLGRPDPATVARVFRMPGELWHAGSLLGQAGRPRLLGFVHPTWMLLRDPQTAHPVSSWRVSPRACLLRVRDWRELGGPPRDGYRTCDAAFLDWGHRLLTRGLLCRHVPELIGDAAVPEAWARPEPLPADDELRLLQRRVGPRLTVWAA